MLHASFSIGLLINPEDIGNMFLQISVKFYWTIYLRDNTLQKFDLSYFAFLKKPTHLLPSISYTTDSKIISCVDGHKSENLDSSFVKSDKSSHKNMKF